VFIELATVSVGDIHRTRAQREQLLYLLVKFLMTTSILNFIQLFSLTRFSLNLRQIQVRQRAVRNLRLILFIQIILFFWPFFRLNVLQCFILSV